MIKLKGLSACNEIVIGKVYKFIEDNLDISGLPCADTDAEVKALEAAKEKSRNQLLEVMESAKAHISEDALKIFEGYIAILEDEEIFEEIKRKITTLKYRAPKAILLVTEDNCKEIESLQDEYLRERAADFRNVARRWIKNILGVDQRDISCIPKNCVIVAGDITPAQVSAMKISGIKGFALEKGGITSHAAILAKSFARGFVMCACGLLDKTKDKDIIIINSPAAEIIINPDEKTLNLYKQKQRESIEKSKKLARIKNKETKTKDGVKVSLLANIAGKEEIEIALANNAEGVGLFRTEFLFMQSDSLPSLEKQAVVYESLSESFAPNPVTIRTLDIGADKKAPCLRIGEECNPSLGCRGIRFCLERQDIFRTQLKALLLASRKHKNIKVMFPMIINMEELLEAKKILRDCKKELDAQHLGYDKNIKAGMMIETPASVMLADSFAKEADFFSIGTNDLTQYILAADRGNEKTQNLCDSYNPAVLAAINKVVETADKNKIEVSMCGELCSDIKAVNLLLGMGLRNFSMSANEILRVKDVILNAAVKESRVLKDKILAQTKISQIKYLLQ